MIASHELPGFGVITRALRRTTEHLAGELTHPGATAPDWNDFEWGVARAVSAMQGITVLLAHRLRWSGPASWRYFLEMQHQQALQRDARIEALIARLDETLRQAGVCAVGLKGTALRRLGLYRPGERPMGDIDVLVSPQDLERCARSIESMEYVPAHESRRHRVFEPRAKPDVTHCGEHQDNPLKIELHRQVNESLPVRFVDITAHVLDGERLPGLNTYSSRIELLRHLLLHAAGNMRAHALRHIQLHDIAILARQIDEAEWQRLRDTPASHGGTWWMWPVLALVERYFPGHLPAAAARLRELSPWLLRTSVTRSTLTDVSWSNLRIAAFPGMCWSRSVLDVLRLMRSRVMPDRLALDELQILNIAQPTMLQLPWYGISHPRRIARWLFTRPARVQTMVSLQAAMSPGDAGP